MSALTEEEISEHTSLQRNEEETLTQECRCLLQTLPSEKGLALYLYLYQGFWYVRRHLNGLLSVQQNFRPHHSDILLATLPKAGTTWLKALLFTLLNRSHHNPNSNNHPLLQHNPHHLVPYLETMVDLNIQKQSPRLFSTHIPFSSLPASINCKIVYLCRNPKDTFISLWHFTNKMIPEGLLRKNGSNMNTLNEAFDKFCRGVNIFGPYWDHVMEYWKASEKMPDKVLFLKFEEIKEQPTEQLRRLARFLECPFSPEEESNGQVEEILRLCSFNKLSGLEVNQNGRLLSGEVNKAFFRKGEVGDWVNYLSDEMIERIDLITKEKLYGSTLTL